MKKLFALIIIIFSTPVVAQNRHTAVKVASTIKMDLEKVVRDYYDHFDHIKGEKIAESTSTIEYQSNLMPQGALESTIMAIKSLHNVYSWEARMLNTDDFDKAVEKYSQLYRQLNGINIFMDNHKSWKFKGPYDPPDESRAFASSILEPDVPEKVVQRLKIEVALSYTMQEWNVKILVYEKEADADIRPTESIEQ